MTAPLVLLSAGGTGGHLFPAESLANALKAAGARVALATDKRVGALAGSFPADEVIQIPSATPSGRSPLRMAGAGVMLGIGVMRAVSALRRMRPAVVVGFGGYPTVPPVLAASLLGIPTAIHEQNGVMGRANRLLARRASMIATGFPNVAGMPKGVRASMVQTGNPVRPSVIEASMIGYPPVLKGGKMRILAFGGSQGARVMSDVVPAAIELLPKELYPQLVIAQQAREEDLLRVRSHYSRLLVHVEVQPFFKDMPRRIADAHLVIARSGASTVAELAVIGRPSILVPLPGALDQDQAANARMLSEIDAALVMPQSEFTPERLAAAIREFFDHPDRLTRAAAAAKSASITDAAERLAQAVMQLASQKKGPTP